MLLAAMQAACCLACRGKLGETTALASGTFDGPAQPSTSLHTLCRSPLHTHAHKLLHDH